MKAPTRHTFAFSRRISPEACNLVVPPQKQREQGMPGARCTRGLVCKWQKENAHEHTGTVGTLRHSLRNGLTAYAVLSSATNSSCHRRWRINGRSKARLGSNNLRQLDTSNGCQDHTVLPYASAPFVLRAVRSLTDKPPCDLARVRRCRVHRILLQRP